MIKKIIIVPNQVILVTNFIDQQLAGYYFDVFKKQVEWRQQKLRLFGKSVLSPRLSAWYGEVEAYYAYSGTVNIPLSWFSQMTDLKDKVSSFVKYEFNSALLNLYRSGSDSMGRHSDDERELGDQPMIVSVSLGGTRNFILHPAGKDQSLKSITVPLISGSMLIMSGQCQQQWQHSIPKTKHPVAERINITFRQINTLRSVST